MMELDEKMLALNQQIQALRKVRLLGRSRGDIKLDEKKKRNEKAKERRKEIMRIAGRINERLIWRMGAEDLRGACIFRFV